MTAVNIAHGEATTIERYKNIKSEMRTRQNFVKHSIQAARNAQIAAEHRFADAMESIDIPIERRLKNDIETFIKTGEGHLPRIMAELEVYYDVEAKTRCYQELK